MSKPTNSSMNSTTTTEKGAASAALTLNMLQRVEYLAVQREAWETTLYARSNEALYSIFDQCLALYRDLTTGDGLKAKKQGLMDYINMKGYVFKASSPLTLKVIRCVFGQKDRRRLSTYHSVLCVAVAEHWEVGIVAQKISERGGIQEISLQKKGDVITTKEKAAAASSALTDQSIATVTGDKLKLHWNKDRVGEDSVAVLTQEADGTYSVRCVVHSTAAVKAVLAAYFAENKETISDLQQQRKQIAVATDQSALIAAAAKAANDNPIAQSA